MKAVGHGQIVVLVMTVSGASKLATGLEQNPSHYRDVNDIMQMAASHLWEALREDEHDRAEYIRKKYEGEPA